MAMYKESKYRNPRGGRLLGALFWEQAATYDYVLYTLKYYDFTIEHEGEVKTFPSLYRLYMEMEDPTEYEFATTYFEGWEHWQLLCRTYWFKPIIAKWRKELEIKIKSQAIKKIKEAAREKSNNTFQANKILLDRPWVENTKSGRGRPSKDEVDVEVKVLAEEERKMEQDLERILNGD